MTPVQENADPEAVHFDYQVSGEEESKEVNIRLQFRKGDEQGEPVALERPSKVLFDNTELKADSTSFMGAFYELSKPAGEFRGKHTILFIDEKGKERKEEFVFEPFTLAAELPENVQKKPFQIRLKGLTDDQVTIRLVMTDTSHLSEDVNEEVVLENGVIDITDQQLSKLARGPVTLEIFREEQKPIGNHTGGGKLTNTYQLRRHFVLVE